MNFVELKLQVQPDFSDILVAELAEIGYESFVDTEDGVNAYIVEDQFKEDNVKELVDRYEPLVRIVYAFNTLEKKNWNEEWEKSYEPITVDDACLVRASFHPSDERFPYQIVITPKMSFGTGHHETTSLMLSSQLRMEYTRKSVLDVGCGTGILAIMASLRGAQRVFAFDNDEWAVENARENVQLNGCNNVEVALGTIQQIMPSGANYDIILANINRNVLLEEIPTYTQYLKSGGWLIVSGFYTKDIPDIAEVAQEARLSPMEQQTRNDWACVIFQKRE